jgi:(S)-citramalyl-CoA lyase
MSVLPLSFDRVTCLLFTPGNRPERFEKVPGTGADGIVIDLEDAVSLGEKDAARSAVIQYLQQHGKVVSDRPFVTAIRINNVHTTAGLKDILALRDSGIMPDVIVMPKVESAEEVQLLEAHLVASQSAIQLVSLIETGQGLDKAARIAKSSARLRALVFGGADLAADIGAVLEWEPMIYARSRIVQAAATAGIAAFDVPYLNLQDMTGLRPECEKVKAMGFRGKMAIHPKHVSTVMQTFKPDASAVERDRRIVASFEAAKGNASEIDGKMIDLPVYRSAKRTLELAGT